MLAIDRPVRKGKRFDVLAPSQEPFAPASASSDRSSKHPLDTAAFREPLGSQGTSASRNAQGSAASRPRRGAPQRHRTSATQRHEQADDTQIAEPAHSLTSSAEGSTVLTSPHDTDESLEADAVSSTSQGGPAASAATGSWRSKSPPVSPARARAEAEAARTRARSKAREAWQLVLEAQSAIGEGVQQPVPSPSRTSVRISVAPAAKSDILLDARVSVFWPQDQAFYRGRILDYNHDDGCHKVLYDDNAEEWLVLGEENFNWLSPRGISAGCCPELQAAMAEHGASGALSPASTPPPARIHAASRSGGPRLDASAVAWQAMVHFTGCQRWCRCEVLAFNAATGRHHVGYDDGEDEWLDLGMESIVWVQAPGLVPFCAGLNAGSQRPQGANAKGWRLAVYWSDDQAFYRGRVASFDSETGLHLVQYDDGELESLDLSKAKIKWLFGPDVPGETRENVPLAPPGSLHHQDSNSPPDASPTQREQLVGGDLDDPEDKRWADVLSLEGRGSSTSLPQTPDRPIPARMPPDLKRRFAEALGLALSDHALKDEAMLPRKRLGDGPAERRTLPDAGSPAGALPKRAAPACFADMLMPLPALAAPVAQQEPDGPREELLEMRESSLSRSAGCTFGSGTALDASESMPQSLLPASAPLATSSSAMLAAPLLHSASSKDCCSPAAAASPHSDMGGNPIEPLDMGIELEDMLLGMDAHEHAAMRW